MKENIGDLIDDLLKEKISDEDLRHLEMMREAHPAIDRLVRESRETFHFLQYARYQQIRTQLREFDEKESRGTKRSPYKRYVFAFVLFLISIMIGWIMIINYYKPENLAKRCFVNIAGLDIMKDESLSNEIVNWDLANELVIKGDFLNAAGLYMVYAEDPESLFYLSSNWNILMCQLAMDGPTDSWRKELDEFKSIPFNPLKLKAIKLSRFLDSTFYKRATLKPSSHFSVWKPRLI